jgi:hypothetical protein
MLAVITLFVLGCGSAFATNYNFGFLSYTGGLEYCNYESFNDNPDPHYVIQGVDNLTLACGGFINATIGGFKSSEPLLAALPIYGGGYAYGDNIYDAFCLCFTGAQWTVFTRKTASLTRWGWLGIASYQQYLFGDNFGFLTKTLPTGKMASAGTTVGRLQVPSRK